MLQDSAKKSDSIRNALDIVIEICKLIKQSPKRTVIFEQCKEELSLSGSGLRPLCPTRWTIRNVAIEAVVRNYPALQEASEVIGKESHDDYGWRATDVLAMLESLVSSLG